MLTIRRTWRAGGLCCTLGALLTLSQGAQATVEEGWPQGTPNNCRNATDHFMDFELGADAAQISSTIPGMVFTTTGGLDWAYGDTRTGNYNVGDYGTQSYETNGNFFAWLGVDGNVGRITFPGGGATYFSALVSSTTLVIEAYDEAGNFLADSGWSPNNVDAGTLTRLTVEASDIAYVELHDSGNFWIIDDICTDAQSPCAPLGDYSTGAPSDRLDLVFIRDAGYTGTMDDFLAAAQAQIDTRLLASAPVSNHPDGFNFYVTELLGDSNTAGAVCGSATLPAGLRTQCPFADAFVVIHSETYGDCTSAGVFSSEGDTVRSFIHEGGHALFQLWDEYNDAPGCGTYRGTTDANVWITEADCLAAATAHGLTGATCTQFTTCGTPSGRWILTNTNSFIMADGTFFANGWGNGSTWWIEEQFGELGPVPAMPSPYTSAERSIVLDVSVNDSTLSVGEVGFTLSPAPNYYSVDYDFIVETWTADGTRIGRYGFNDPRIIQGESGYVGSSWLELGQLEVVIPDHFAIASATISSEDYGTLTVAIGNHTPRATDPMPDAGGPYVVNEGELITLDGSASTGAIVRYEWDHDGDGEIEVGSTDSVTTSWAEDDYSGPVYLRVLDAEGLSMVATSSIVVQNVPPNVTVGDDLVTTVGETLEVEGAFSDPGLLDTHTIEWVWGDGTVTTGDLAPSHVYEEQGVYEVMLRVTDDDGGVGEASFFVTVYHNACLLGQQVTLRDRAKVQAPLGAYGYAQFGVEATLVGDSVVNGTATLYDRANLTGSLVLAQSAVRGNGVVVTDGLVEYHQPNYLPTMPTRSVVAGTGDLFLSGTQTLVPGSYGAVTIRPNALVSLSAGTYRFASLNVEPEAVLVVGGAIVIEVAGDVGFGDRAQLQSSSTDAVLLYTNGATCRIGNDAAFSGIVVAPYADVTISSRTTFRGCAGGKTVDVQPDARVESDGLVLPQVE